MRVSIRFKLLLTITGILFIVLATNTYLQMTLQKKAFDHELEQRTVLLRENLHQRALSQAETLKHLIAEYIAAYKFLELNNTAIQAVEETSELSKVIILDKLNQVYVDTSDKNNNGIYQEELDSKTSTKFPDFKNIHQDYSVREIQLKESVGLELEVPINIGQEVWGHILLIYSLSELNAQILESTRTHQSQQDALMLKTLSITFSLLLFAYMVTHQLSKKFISPIITLTNYTQDLALGDFSSIPTISNPSNDEIGDLTQNFVSMAKNLENNHIELANYNQILEQKVEHRTYALNLNNLALKKALSDLEESQQQLIHSEKMAALGQLISGIAHEINTPLGAIKASAGNNSKSFRKFEKGLPHYLDQITEDDKNLLILILKKSIEKSENGIIFSSREERQQKKQIHSYLEELHIKDADILTELLLDMVNVADLEELSTYLNNKNTLQIVELAHNLSALERNNQTIQTAISKASKVVFSLKNFSHHDMSGNKILSNINYGITTVLVLYQNFLKQGCNVVENYADLPEILCYPDELNQVWTNLIHNALYAMQNIGTITIDTKVESNMIVVCITDDGSGIPKEIQEKVFTTFFTTKPAGEGSGLGLGICKRIIDKHEGEISLDSRPSATSFTVKLPILES
jgi:signal transduction histidine kinase